MYTLKNKDAEPIVTNWTEKTWKSKSRENKPKLLEAAALRLFHISIELGLYNSQLMDIEMPETYYNEAFDVAKQLNDYTLPFVNKFINDPGSIRVFKMVDALVDRRINDYLNMFYAPLFEDNLIVNDMGVVSFPIERLNKMVDYFTPVVKLQQDLLALIKNHPDADHKAYDLDNRFVLNDLDGIYVQIQSPYDGKRKIQIPYSERLKAAFTHFKAVLQQEVNDLNWENGRALLQDTAHAHKLNAVTEAIALQKANKTYRGMLAVHQEEIGKVLDSGNTKTAKAM